MEPMGRVTAAIGSIPEQQLQQTQLFLQDLTPYVPQFAERPNDRKSKYVEAFETFVTDVLKKPCVTPALPPVTNHPPADNPSRDPKVAEFPDFVFLAALPGILSPSARKVASWETMMAYGSACPGDMRFSNKEWSDTSKIDVLQKVLKQITDLRFVFVDPDRATCCWSKLSGTAPMARPAWLSSFTLPEFETP